MQDKRALFLAFLWLAMSLLLAAYLPAASESHLLRTVIGNLEPRLIQVLDESHFGAGAQQPNDHGAIKNIGAQINADLASSITSLWYAPLQACEVALSRIDDVAIASGSPGKTFSFSLSRNQISRDITASISCANNWLPGLAAGGMLGLLFIILWRLLPKPLTAAQNEWLGDLRRWGYSEDQAMRVIDSVESRDLRLNAAQRACFERLHINQDKNATAVLRLVAGTRVAALDDKSLEWLVLGWTKITCGNIEEALRLASAPDKVEIDLTAMQLEIRGVQVAMAKTPLFYYAWYAMARLSGDGWVGNPASNRPDMDQGRQLAVLMSQYAGHARAISDLEQSGLKARTLDQNRGKLKDEITAALGENLAETYLFESSRDPDGIHTRYRLRVEPEAIQIIK